MITKYLEEAGIAAHIVSSDNPLESHLTYANIIFASPDYLDALNNVIAGDPQNWVPARICVSEIGDDVSDRLLREGIAEDLLIRPISRRDMFDQIERIVEGRLRGSESLKSVSPSQRETPRFSGARVLAADDSAVNREVVKEALARLEIAATIVADGAEAVEAFEAGAFDLILMDCSMPIMDGFEAARRIRELEAKFGVRTPIIALTAHVEGAGADWRAAGMDDYVTKPFTLMQLATAISQFIKPTASMEREVAGKTLPRPARAQMHDLAHDLASRFDASVLHELRAMQSGSGDLVGRALDLFEEHSKEGMLRLARAVKARDSGEIASAAHALKSMAFNVGARRLGEACALVERHAADFASLPERLRDVRREYSAAIDELPKIRRAFARAAA